METNDELIRCSSAPANQTLISAQTSSRVKQTLTCHTFATNCWLINQSEPDNQSAVTFTGLCTDMPRAVCSPHIYRVGQK